MKVKSLSCVWLFGTPWTVAHQAPLSLELSWKEYWNGLLHPPPGDLPYPGTEPTSSVAPALAGGFFTTEPSGKPIAERNVQPLNCVWLCMTPWTVARQASLSFIISPSLLKLKSMMPHKHILIYIYWHTHTHTHMHTHTCQSLQAFTNYSVIYNRKFKIANVMCLILNSRYSLYLS